MKSDKDYIENVFRKKELALVMKDEKRRKLKKRVILAGVAVAFCAIILIIAIPMIFKGDKNNVVYAKDLTRGFVSTKIAEIDGRKPDEIFTKAYLNFAFEMFHNTLKEDESVMVSPLSAYIALAMTANGADGNTKAEMEEVFGVDVDSLNSYFLSYAETLTADSEARFMIANSIWLRNDNALVVKDEFLQTNADYYDAEVYKTDFDEKTIDDINNWVEKNTDGMIEEIISEIKQEEMLYLINAIAFDAKWDIPYTEASIIQGIFTNADGGAENVEYLCGSEYYYIEDNNSIGFVKDYEGDYAFVAVLPDEEVSIEEYVDAMTADKWLSLLENNQYATVHTRIPEFEHECTISLSDTLKKMGMNEAFSEDGADFTRMGSYGGEGLYISGAVQRTYISVNEAGTRAGAVTAVKMSANTSAQKSIEIHLNRPFVYAIIDTNTNLPIFIGTVQWVH